MDENDLKMLERSLHFIPTGRQLPRTPRLSEVKKRLDLSNEDTKSHIVAFHQDTEGDSGQQPDPGVIESSTSDTKQGLSGYSDSLMNGMKLTPGDLDIMRKMQVEKQVQQLQGELETLQKLMEKQLLLEPTLVSSENMQADLENMVAHHNRMLGIMWSSGNELELKARSLLAVVTKEDVDRASSKNKKKQALGHMADDTTRTKEDSKERAQLAKQLVGCQMAIQQLMREMSQLKSKLEMDRRELVTPVAPKTDLPAGRKPASKATSKSTNKGNKSPSKSTVERKPKAAAGQQKLAAESKPAGGVRGRPKAVRNAKAAAPQVESVKEADNAKWRAKQQQEEEEQPTIVLRRSKRIANRR